MITDKVGANYYKSIGLEDIWDLGIDVSLEDIMIKLIVIYSGQQESFMP